MTRDEFVANGIAWHGSAVGWQSALARALGVRTDTIRKACKDGPSDALAAAVMELFGEAVPTRVPAEWICGDGSDGREYLVHTLAPRFLCLVMTDEEYADFEHQAEGDFMSEDFVLCGFHWIDRRPSNYANLMERAADAVESFT